jgi:hypothetical protein
MSEIEAQGERRLEVTRAADGRVVLTSSGGGLPVGIRMTDAEAQAVVEAMQEVLQPPVAMRKHKHAGIVAAWVNGARIQGQSPTTDGWFDVPAADRLGEDQNYLEPSPIHPDYDWWPNWRIAPEAVSSR